MGATNLAALFVGHYHADHWIDIGPLRYRFPWAEPAPRPLTYSGPAEDGATEVRAGGNRGRHARNGAEGPAVVGGQEPSRNAPCPCNSGKKYKRCHGAPTTARSRS